MEKTIEQQIAEGVAKGIQQVKNDEIEKKRQKGKNTLMGYVLFFVIFFLSMVVLSFIREKFGIEKHEFGKNYAYPLAVIAQLGFSIFFFRKDFKTHFWVVSFVTLINSFGTGYFVALMIK